MKYYQQGDVLLKKVSNLPEGAKKLDGTVLQLGEVTGHKHQFLNQSDRVQLFADSKFIGVENSITPDEGKFVVITDEVAFLTHEEHKQIALDPGVYQVDIVREFSYEDMEATRVVD